jgi:membrane fusion protein (multidrug efflux system)
MNRRGLVGSILLFVTIAGVGAGLTASKCASLRAEEAAAASQPEPMESVIAAIARERPYRRTTTSIGTVRALRSITLRNEVPGTVRQVSLTPGQIVDAGTLLVALDVAVEEAELRALEAQAHLAETILGRTQDLGQQGIVPVTELDRVRAERDVAVAQIARTRAIIARKTIRAPFRARVGIADLHPGQYLDEGAELTTLQGVDGGAHVEFAVAQRVAAGLKVGESVEVFPSGEKASLTANIVALDARVDPSTRNATVRARIGSGAPAPGASVRVEVPVGPPEAIVAVPASALRKGPSGDHLFVLAPDKDGKIRAQMRQVQSGPILGDEVVIHAGLAAGEQVAASGSFKLREAALVQVAGDDTGASAPGTATASSNTR